VALEDPGLVVGLLERVEGWRSSSMVAKRLIHRRFSLSVRMNRSTQPLLSGSRMKEGELAMPRKASPRW
jgi:hypothetical protein